MVLKRFFTPRWLGAFVLAILFSVACYHLGHWQYSKYVYKSERNERLDTNYRADARPLGEVITHAPLPIESQWTHVEATGTYAADAQLYVRNRPNNGVYGYEVLAPLRLPDGTVVVVDRGWVANSPLGAHVLPEVPPTPSGAVTVTGWALPSEESFGRSLPAGQIDAVNTDEAARAWDTPVLGGVLRLQEEITAEGKVAERPEELERPDRSLGPHQAYAIQWWLTMPLGFVLLWFGIRRELRLETEARGDGVDPDSTTANRDKAKPKKVRIWDEEDA